MADDKRLKLKEVTQGKVFTPQAPIRLNTGLTHYACLNNEPKVKQLILYKYEIKIGHYFANKKMFKVSNKIFIRGSCVNVVQS